MDEAYSPLELMLFGTPDVRVDGVSVQRALSHKGVLLLAFLALYSGRPVSTSVIAEAVFPDSQSEDPHEVIKKIVQQVRRALGEEAYRLSAPAPRTLALDLEGAHCDWAMFHTMQKEHRPESLRHAIALHVRPFLETEIYGWVGAEQVRCLRLRQEALETLFRHAIQSTDLASAAQCLSEQLLFDSSFITLKEALWRELYLLLLHRQEFGLFHFHYLQLRAFLERTAGREPEPETQALYQKIPKSVLIQILQARERKKKSSLPDTVRLPSFPLALLGRDARKRELKAAFTHSRLCTVVGVGGIGKTRFTVEAAQEIAGELKADVGFIDLIPASPDTFLRTVATVLGIKESVGVSLSLALKEYLFPKQVLLILDNCEHVIEAAADLASALLQDCPNLRLLCTSRETLRVDGEQVFPLPPLDVPSLVMPTGSSLTTSALQVCRESDAVRLFCERASSVKPDFQLTARNAPFVVELCRLTDGLPLGIEIVASQVSVMPLERIAANLADCILHIRHRKRGIPARHQTLVAALDWSYHCLSPAEQSLFRRLSLFSGGWTLEAAERICSDESLPVEEISSLLSDLASKSLVNLIASDSEELRFSFLETVRVYAEEQLQETSEWERFEQRHMDYFIALAEEAERQMSGKDQQAWLLRLDSEYPNMRRCLQVSLEQESASGLRLAHGLSRYWEIRGHLWEGREWTSAILARTAPTERTLPRARVLDIDGWFREILGDPEHAGPLLEESLEIFLEQGDSTSASITLIRLGLAARNRGDVVRARTLFERSLALRRVLRDPRLIVIALMNLGSVACNLSEFAQAQALYEEAIAMLEQVDDRRLEANCLNALGDLVHLQSDLPRASSLFEKSLSMFRELGDRYLMRYPLFHLGTIAFALEDFEQSFSYFAECLVLSQEMKVPYHTMYCLEGLANIAAKRRQWDRAVRLWGAVERRYSLRQSVLFPSEQALHDQLILEAIAFLGEETYGRFFAEGELLSAEEAVETALESTPL